MSELLLVVVVVVVPHPLSFCPFSFGFSSSFVHFIIVEVLGFGFHIWVSCPSHSQSSMINISAFACHISMNIGNELDGWKHDGWALASG